ncbi:Signal transduction response regulator, receiver domain [Dillenia turbinata]|uniref:Signal transduction response regulator, receiver domain n=1 Tax=Dillenia turbinata TaxID=194707 RepID=A0AAN8ZV88_9MAGN
MNILVVDDDNICLTIVATQLMRCKYKVVTAKNGFEALQLLRSHDRSFDLVLTDVHMPCMDGICLMREVKQEFNIPVVLMSADDKESNITTGIELGASIYIVKPVKRYEIEELWQFAITKKKGKVVATHNGDEGIPRRSPPLYPTSKNIDLPSSSSEDTMKQPRGHTKRKGDRWNKDSATTNCSRPRRSYMNSGKPKVIWSYELHSLFLEAIRELGFEEAVPKKILKYMNRPELTRENVASHLQKFRDYCKRVTHVQNINSQNRYTKELTDRALKSCFALGLPQDVIDTLRRQSQMFQEHQYYVRPYTNNGGPIIEQNLGIRRNPSQATQENSGMNTGAQVWHGQPNLLTNREANSLGNVQNPQMSMLMNNNAASMRGSQQQCILAQPPIFSNGPFMHNGGDLLGPSNQMGFMNGGVVLNGGFHAQQPFGMGNGSGGSNGFGWTSGMTNVPATPIVIRDPSSSHIAQNGIVFSSAPAWPPSQFPSNFLRGEGSAFDTTPAPPAPQEIDDNQNEEFHVWLDFVQSQEEGGEATNDPQDHSKTYGAGDNPLQIQQPVNQGQGEANEKNPSNNGDIGAGDDIDEFFNWDNSNTNQAIKLAMLQQVGGENVESKAEEESEHPQDMNGSFDQDNIGDILDSLYEGHPFIDFDKL